MEEPRRLRSRFRPAGQRFAVEHWRQSFAEVVIAMRRDREQNCLDKSKGKCHLNDAMVADEIKFIDSSQLPSTWKTAPRGWGHPLHKLSQYIGQYPPCLAHFFIRQYSQPGQTVFDPFSGGGTTALEALLSGREAFAIDAFNYAYTLSHAKTRPMELRAIGLAQKN